MRFARARTTRRASRQLPRHRVDLATSRSRRVGRMRRAGRSIGEANAPPQRWRIARRGPSGRTFAVPVKVICPPAGGVVRAGVLRWRETIEDGTEPLKQPQARGRARRARECEMAPPRSDARGAALAFSFPPTLPPPRATRAKLRFQVDADDDVKKQHPSPPPLAHAPLPRCRTRVNPSAAAASSAVLR